MLSYIQTPRGNDCDFIYFFGVTSRATVDSGFVLCWSKLKLGGYRQQENCKIIFLMRESV